MKPCLCPECGATLQIITDGFVGEEWADAVYVMGDKRPVRMVQKPFAVCMRCEYCLDFLKS